MPANTGVRTPCRLGGDYSDDRINKSEAKAPTAATTISSNQTREHRMPGLGNAPKPIRRSGCRPQFFSGDPTQQAIKATIIWGRRIT
jgi:hypothetical protein